MTFVLRWLPAGVWCALIALLLAMSYALDWRMP